MTITTDELAAQPSAASSGTGPARLATGRRSVLRRLLFSQLSGIILAFVVWEVVPRIGLVPQRYIPPFTEVLPQFVTELGRAEFWVAAGNTLWAWAIGLGIGAVVGVLIGVVIGSSAAAYRATRFVLEFLRPIPSVALIPLAVLLFGINGQMKVSLVIFATVWPILIQTVYGVRELDPVARDTARSFGYSGWDVFWHVTLPTAAPSIATGIRIASALAVVIAVTAELITGVSGLGAEVLFAQSAGSSVRLYALILAIGIVSYALSQVIEAVERRLLRWHVSFRKEHA
ncbi:ABC transporter permease [Nocardioides sp. T5]|uniref:ABC transporter permease n=1 Tax=Nocardioides sp. T5 TaxID=3400182 RepID=UPI003A8ACDDC